MKEVWLTTKDNPFNPFTQFHEWFRFDFEKGHHSNEVLARFAIVPDSFSESEKLEEIEKAIDHIIQVDPEQKFTKVYRE